MYVSYLVNTYGSFRTLYRALPQLKREFIELGPSLNLREHPKACLLSLILFSKVLLALFYIFIYSFIRSSIQSLHAHAAQSRGAPLGFAVLLSNF